MSAHSPEKGLPSGTPASRQIDARTSPPVASGSPGWRRTTRLALALAPPLLALMTGGCQSLSPLSWQHAQATAEGDPRLGTVLADSIDAIARSRGRPEALASSEARHRRLLSSHLRRLLEDATPPRPSVGVEPEDGLLDPAGLSQAEPVIRPRAKPAGLERAGIGLPVVARLPAPQDPNAPRSGYHLPATLVAEPGDPHRRLGAAELADPSLATEAPKARTDCCKAALVDPDQVEQVPTASGTLPVAMDLYAPLRATKATGVRPIDGLANLVRPGRFTGQPRIVFLRPFDPDKTPVVLVHGLLSTPGIWEPLVTQLLADPRIRECCQLWFFYYPSGQPVPLSALQLHEALDDAVARTGSRHKMILIGHSMGGILSRRQVSRISPAQAEQVLPGLTDLAEYNRVRRALIFEPRDDVSRVVFLFVPHRGSRLAANSLGALAIRLIRLPDTLLNEAEYALDRLAGEESRRLPTSIQGLSPRSPFLRALSKTTPTVPVHSIIGNRGRGDGSTGSDGVVPVRSARVASAESELIVPTGHGGFDHPAAVDEIKRIILMDVSQQQASGGTLAHSITEPLGPASARYRTSDEMIPIRVTRLHFPED